MDIKNKQVIHKNYGAGSVIAQYDNYVEVEFETGNKKFIYPDAFGTFLTLTDKNAEKYVKKLNQAKEEELRKKSKELQKQKESEQQLLIRKSYIRNLKVHPSSQAAFWCELEERDNVFSEWAITANVFRGNVNKKRPARMLPNSACIITAKHNGTSEKDRCILGIFMTQEDFIGKTCEDGIIKAHSKYRLRLSEQESKKMLFWNYYKSEKTPTNIVWNKVRYRYIKNEFVAQILRDIVILRSNTEEQNSAQEFFEYFCEINKIDKNLLPKAGGALMLMQTQLC